MSMLRTEHIVKEYPGTTALNDVSISFESGKIHALIGKNGSGKSTLLNIISGATKQTSGNIYLDERLLRINNTHDAFVEGIVTIYQELSLMNALSVAENIFVGRLPRKKTGLVDWEKTYRAADKLMEELGMKISVKSKVSSLSISEKQMVEIAKAMSFSPKVLLMDEPTSALTKEETQSIFTLMRNLKNQGVLIIYVTHRLQELWEVADTCTILRDAKLIGTVPLPKTERKTVLKMMFGEVEIKHRPDDIAVKDTIALEVRGLYRYGKFENISFALKHGEILGIAGMLGAGRTELLRSIFGAEPYDSGHVYVAGKRVTKPSPEKMKMRGVAMIQEDRGRDGIIPQLSIKSNICVTNLHSVRGKVLVSKKTEATVAQKQVDALHIKVSNINNRITSLSGGNQQKVIVGKWLNTKPKVILFDEPSRGIDVNAKQQIFQIMWNLSREGISCIMVSSELEELLEVCNRIIVMQDGKFIEEINNPENMRIDELYSKCMREESHG